METLDVTMNNSNNSATNHDNNIVTNPFIPYRKFTSTQQQGVVPSQRSQIALVACPPRHSLFCLGGVLEVKTSDRSMDVYEFDLRSGVWQKHFSLSKNPINSMWGMKCVYRKADHSIYCFGGNISLIGYNLSSYGVFCLDLNTFTWKTRLNRVGKQRWRIATNSPKGHPYQSPNSEIKLGSTRYAHAMEMKGDQSGFVIFGGEGETIENDDFLEFDFRDLLWKPVEVVAGGERPLSRHVLCSAMTGNNQFFIFGGRSRHSTGEDSSLYNLEYFDFNCKTWFKVDWNYSFPEARFAAGMSSFQSYGKPKFISESMKFNHNYDSQYDYLILHGGRNDSHRFKDTQVYSVEERIWKECKLVDDSLSNVDNQREEEVLKSEMKKITLSKERKLKKKILSDDDIIFRGGNIGLCIGYNDINFKSNCLFYDYANGMTTFSRPIVSSYPTNLSKKFLSFGGKTGHTGYNVYDSSLLTFDLTHFDYQNDPSLLIDPTKSASTDAVFEEISTKLLVEKKFTDYNLLSTDGDLFPCHKFMLSHIQYFRDLFEKKVESTTLSTLELGCLLKYCYGIELTPIDVDLPYHSNEVPTTTHLDFTNFIQLYSSILTLNMTDMIDYLRKLLCISINIKMAVNLFKIVAEKVNKVNSNQSLKDLIFFSVNYLSFNCLPTLDCIRERQMDLFFSENNFTEDQISQFKFYSEASELTINFKFEEYITRRVKLAREYMYTNFSMLMNSSVEASKINTNVTFVLTVEDRTWKISVPKALICVRFEYFNNLLNNSFARMDNDDAEIDISDLSMIFYLPNQSHPLISLASVVYFAYTNDVDFENLILCKSVFPKSDDDHDTISPSSSYEVNQDTIIQYIIDIYSLADFLSDISMKESLLQYVRRLVSRQTLVGSRLIEAAKELQKVDFEVLSEIAEIFTDCTLEQQAIEANEMVLKAKPAPVVYFEDEEDDGEWSDDDDDDQDDDNSN